MMLLEVIFFGYPIDKNGQRRAVWGERLGLTWGCGVLRDSSTALRMTTVCAGEKGKATAKTKAKFGGPLRLRSGQALHCATDDETVRRFGRDDDVISFVRAASCRSGWC